MTTKAININELMQYSGVNFGTSGVRGLVSSMTDEVCYAYCAAFLKEVVNKSSAVSKVVLGHDLRPSSPGIASVCATAIKDAGLEVVYAGALPTPALAAYAHEINAASIVITGSHIPFDRNGMKFYRADGEISKADEHAIKNSIVDVPLGLEVNPLSTVDYDAEAHYIHRYIDFFGADYFNKTRVALYEHSSVARDLLRKILVALGAEVISLGRTDSFTPIDTEAVRPEDVLQAKEWAQVHHFDAIFSTDGDADRPLIGDELGQWLRGDVVGILCAKFLKANVVATPVSSNTVAERSGWFDSVLRTRIGSPYVIAAMESVNDLKAIVAGFEANGGFLLGTNVLRNGNKLTALPTRDAVLPMLALLGLAKEQGTKLSELALTLPDRYTHSDRLQNFPTEISTELVALLKQDRKKIIEIMSQHSGDIVLIDETDGFRVTFSNGDIVHLRPSGNAPELRCYAEAETQARAQELCSSCLAVVAGCR